MWPAPDGQLLGQRGGTDVGRDGGEQTHVVRGRITGIQFRRGGVEFPGRCGEHPAGAGDPRPDFVGG